MFSNWAISATGRARLFPSRESARPAIFLTGSPSIFPSLSPLSGLSYLQNEDSSNRLVRREPPSTVGSVGDLLVIWQLWQEFRVKTALNPRRRYSGCESSRLVLESRSSIDFFHQPHFV